MPSEFDLIQTYFNWHNTGKPSASGIIKGIGDDGAVLQVPSNKQLIVTTDTLISGVHFPEETAAHAIGYKSLAVNLSDLAAMGADPAWFTLALTLPNQDKEWLKGFSIGLKTLASQANIKLIGGDTTKGPLSISITAMGLADTEHLMLRSNAKHNDIIYVTGTLGDAAAGLAMVQQRYELDDNESSCIEKLNYPTPRNKESEIIRAYAKTCLDISDGFLADLNHILQASRVGAKIELSNIPLSKALKQINHQTALKYALSGGDDYELLFTVSKENQTTFEQCIQQKKLTCTAVGKIDASITGIVSTRNKIINPAGYNHFHDL